MWYLIVWAFKVFAETCLSPAFIILNDLRKREREKAKARESFFICSWDDLKSCGDFLHGNSGIAGDAGRWGGSWLVLLSACYLLARPLSAWNRGLFRKSVCIHTAHGFYFIFYFMFLFYFYFVVYFIFFIFCECSLFYINYTIDLNQYWN